MPIDPIDLIRLLAEMKRHAPEDIEEENEESIEEASTEETSVRAAPAAPLSRRVERVVAQRAHENDRLASPATAALKNNQPETPPPAVLSLEKASPSIAAPTLADMLRNPRIFPYAVVLWEILSPPMAERDPLQRWPLM